MQADEILDEARDAGGGMTLLDRAQIKVLRIRTALASAIPAGGAFALDVTLLRDTPSPAYLATAAALLLALVAVAVLPGRRYRAWGYHEGEDELAIRRGLWIRVRTVVPFGRVQHIDVAQGPIERRFDLATLILHTAGTRSAAVPLPGLKHAQAEAMRDRIRAKIRQDLV